MKTKIGFVVSMLFALNASAGEGIFGWIYTLDLQPKGKAEFEQRAQWNHRQQGEYDNWKLRSEIEYGLTDNIQIGGYVNLDYINAYQNDKFGQTAGSDISEFIDTSKRYQRFRFDSVSLEAIWRITNPYTDSIGIGLYLEPEIGPDIKELEARLLLQKNFIDDRLIVASNLVFTTERDELANKYRPEKASHFDLLAGVSYHFTDNWNAGFDYRYHNDYAGYFYQTTTQHAHFIGPNLHYATTDWWGTVAWRHQISGTCLNDGIDECSSGYVNDDHGRDELMFKFGIPL